MANSKFDLQPYDFLMCSYFSSLLGYGYYVRCFSVKIIHFILKVRRSDSSENILASSCGLWEK